MTNRSNLDVSSDDDIFESKNCLMFDDDDATMDNYFTKSQLNVDVNVIASDNKGKEQIKQNKGLNTNLCEQKDYFSPSEVIYISDDSVPSKKLKKPTEKPIIISPQNSKSLLKKKAKEKKVQEKQTGNKKEIYTSIQKELETMSLPFSTDIKIEKKKKKKKIEKERIKTSIHKQEPLQQQHVRPLKQQKRMEIEPQVNSQLKEIETIDLQQITQNIRDHYSKKKKSLMQLNKILEVSQLFDSSKDLMTNYQKIFNKDHNLNIQLLEIGYEYYASLFFQLSSRLKNSSNNVIEIKNESDINPIILKDLNKKKLSASKVDDSKSNEIHQSNHNEFDNINTHNKESRKSAIENKEKSTNNLMKDIEMTQISQPNRKYGNNERMNIDDDNEDDDNDEDDDDDDNTINYSKLNKLQQIDKKTIDKLKHDMGVNLVQDSFDMKREKEKIEDNNNYKEKKNEANPKTSSIPLKTKQEVDEYIKQDPIYSTVKEKIKELNSNKKAAMEYLDLSLHDNVINFIRNIINGRIQVNSTNQPLMIELYRNDYFISSLMYDNHSFFIYEQYLNLIE